MGADRENLTTCTWTRALLLLGEMSLHGLQLHQHSEPHFQTVFGRRLRMFNHSSKWTVSVNTMALGRTNLR